MMCCAWMVIKRTTSASIFKIWKQILFIYTEKITPTIPKIWHKTKTQNYHNTPSTLRLKQIFCVCCGCAISIESHTHNTAYVIDAVIKFNNNTELYPASRELKMWMASVTQTNNNSNEREKKKQSHL